MTIEQTLPSVDHSPPVETKKGFSLADVADLLYPEGGLPSPAEMAPLLSGIDTLLQHTGIPTEFSGTLPILMAAKKTQLFPQPALMLSPFALQKNFADWRLDHQTKVRLWDMIDAPTLQATVATTADIEMMYQSIVQTLHSADQKPHEEPRPTNSPWTAWEQPKRAVDHPSLKRKEFYLPDKKVTYVTISQNDERWTMKEKQGVRMIVKKGIKEGGAPYVSLTMATDNDDKKPIKPGRKYADGTSLCTIEITPRDATSSPVLSWERAPASVDKLAAPMEVDEDTFHQIPRLGRLTTAVKMLEYAMIGETNLFATEEGRQQLHQSFDKYGKKGTVCAPAIADESLRIIDEEMDRLGLENAQTGRNSIQQKLYELAQDGHNVRPYVEHIGTTLARLAQQNPGRFWRYFRALELYSIFPVMSELGYSDVAQIDQALHKDFSADSSLKTLWNSQGKFLHLSHTREILYDEALSTTNQTSLDPRKPNYHQGFINGYQRIVAALFPHLPPPNERHPPISRFFQAFDLLPNVVPDIPPPEPQPQWDKEDVLHMQQCIQLSKTVPEEIDPFVCRLVLTRKSSYQGQGVESVVINAINKTNPKNRSGHQIHAEIVALDRVPEIYRQYLSDDWKITAYTNAEPCLSCVQQMLENKVSRVVYAIPSQMGGFSHGLANNQAFKLAALSGSSGMCYELKDVPGLMLPEALAVFQSRSNFRHIFDGAMKWYEENVMKPTKEKHKKTLQYDEYV